MADIKPSRVIPGRAAVTPKGAAVVAERTAVIPQPMPVIPLPIPVIPAKAGIHTRRVKEAAPRAWIPDHVRDDGESRGWLALCFSLLVLLGALLPAPARAAHSTPKQCYLAVDGKRLVQGRCLVYPLGDGGYTLNTWERGKPRHSHFAQVNAAPGGSGDATWNADPDDDHALDPLGRVRLVHGCWVNRRTRICAR